MGFKFHFGYILRIDFIKDFKLYASFRRVWGKIIQNITQISQFHNYMFLLNSDCFIYSFLLMFCLSKFFYEYPTYLWHTLMKFWDFFSKCCIIFLLKVCELLVLYHSIITHCSSCSIRQASQQFSRHKTL